MQSLLREDKDGFYCNAVTITENAIQKLAIVQPKYFKDKIFCGFMDLSILYWYFQIAKPLYTIVIEGKNFQGNVFGVI